MFVHVLFEAFLDCDKIRLKYILCQEHKIIMLYTNNYYLAHEI